MKGTGATGSRFSLLATIAFIALTIFAAQHLPAASAAENIEDAVLASLGMADNAALRDGLRSVRETITSAVDYAKGQLAAAGIVAPAAGGVAGATDPVDNAYAQSEHEIIKETSETKDENAEKAEPVGEEDL